MAYLTLEDTTGSIGVIVFPKAYNKYVSLLDPDNILLVKATLRRQEEEVKLSCDSIRKVDDSLFENSEDQPIEGNLLIKLPKGEELEKTLMALKGIFSRYRQQSCLSGSGV